MTQTKKNTQLPKNRSQKGGMLGSLTSVSSDSVAPPVAPAPPTPATFDINLTVKQAYAEANQKYSNLDYEEALKTSKSTCDNAVKEVEEEYKTSIEKNTVNGKLAYITALAKTQHDALQIGKESPIYVLADSIYNNSLNILDEDTYSEPKFNAVRAAIKRDINIAVDDIIKTLPPEAKQTSKIATLTVFSSATQIAGTNYTELMAAKKTADIGIATFIDAKATQQAESKKEAEAKQKYAQIKSETKTITPNDTIYEAEHMVDTTKELQKSYEAAYSKNDFNQIAIIAQKAYNRAEAAAKLATQLTENSSDDLKQLAKTAQLTANKAKIQSVSTKDTFSASGVDPTLNANSIDAAKQGLITINTELILSQALQTSSTNLMTASGAIKTSINETTINELQHAEMNVREVSEALTQSSEFATSSNVQQTAQELLLESKKNTDPNSQVVISASNDILSAAPTVADVAGQKAILSTKLLYAMVPQNMKDSARNIVDSFHKIKDAQAYFQSLNNLELVTKIATELKKNPAYNSVNGILTSIHEINEISKKNQELNISVEDIVKKVDLTQPAIEMKSNETATDKSINSAIDKSANSARYGFVQNSIPSLYTIFTRCLREILNQTRVAPATDPPELIRARDYIRDLVNRTNLPDWNELYNIFLEIISNIYNPVGVAIPNINKFVQSRQVLLTAESNALTIKNNIDTLLRNEPVEIKNFLKVQATVIQQMKQTYIYVKMAVQHAIKAQEIHQQIIPGMPQDQFATLKSQLNQIIVQFNLQPLEIVYGIPIPDLPNSFADAIRLADQSDLAVVYVEQAERSLQMAIGDPDTTSAQWINAQTLSSNALNAIQELKRQHVNLIHTVLRNQRIVQDISVSSFFDVQKELSNVGNLIIRNVISFIKDKITIDSTEDISNLAIPNDTESSVKTNALQSYQAPSILAAQTTQQLYIDQLTGKLGALMNELRAQPVQTRMSKIKGMMVNKTEQLNKEIAFIRSQIPENQPFVKSMGLIKCAIQALVYTTRETCDHLYSYEKIHTFDDKPLQMYSTLAIEEVTRAMSLQNNPYDIQTLFQAIQEASKAIVALKTNVTQYSTIKASIMDKSTIAVQLAKKLVTLTGTDEPSKKIANVILNELEYYHITQSIYSGTVEMSVGRLNHTTELFIQNSNKSMLDDNKSKIIDRLLKNMVQPIIQTSVRIQIGDNLKEEVKKSIEKAILSNYMNDTIQIAAASYIQSVQQAIVASRQVQSAKSAPTSNIELNKITENKLKELFQLISEEVNQVLRIESEYQSEYNGRLLHLPTPVPGVPAAEFMIKKSKEQALYQGFINSSQYTNVLIKPTVRSVVPQLNEIANTSIQKTVDDLRTYSTAILTENKTSFIEIARAISSASLKMAGAKPLARLSNGIVESYETIQKYNKNINLLPIIQSFTTLKLQTLMNISKDALYESSSYEAASKKVFESSSPGDDRIKAAQNMAIATNRLVSKTKLMSIFIDEVIEISQHLNNPELSTMLLDAKREIGVSIQKAEESATKVSSALQKLNKSTLSSAAIYTKWFNEIDSIYKESQVQVEISIKTLDNAYDIHIQKLTNSETIKNERLCVKKAQDVYNVTEKFVKQPIVTNVETVLTASKTFDETVKQMITNQKNDIGKSSKQAIQFAIETAELFLKIAKSKMNYVKDIKAERKFIEKLKLFIDVNKKIDKSVDYDFEQKGLQISRAAQNIFDAIDIPSKAPQACKEAIESATHILQQAKMKSLYLLNNAEKEYTSIERTVDKYKSIVKFETSSTTLQLIKDFDSQLNEAITKLADPLDTISSAISVDSAISTIDKYNQHLKITQNDVYLEVIKYAKLLLDSVNAINKISNVKTNQELIDMIATSTKEVPGNGGSTNAIAAAVEATKGTFKEKIIQSIIHSAPDITLDIVQRAILFAIRDSFDKSSSISDDKITALKALQQAEPKKGIVSRMAKMKGGSAVTPDKSALLATYKHIIADSELKLDGFYKAAADIATSREQVLEHIKLRVAKDKKSKLGEVSNIKNDDIVKRENQFIKARDTDVYKILIKTQGIPHLDQYNNWASSIDKSQYIKNKLKKILDETTLKQFIYELCVLMIIDKNVNGAIHSTIETFTSDPNSDVGIFVDDVIKLVKQIDQYYYSFELVNGVYTMSANTRTGIKNEDMTTQLQKYADIDGKLDELTQDEDPEVVIRWNTLKYLQTKKTDTIDTDATKLSEYYHKIIPRLMKYRCNKSYIDITYPSTCDKRYIEAAFLINIFKQDLEKYKEKDGAISGLSMSQYDAYLNKFEQMDTGVIADINLDKIQSDVSNIITKIKHIAGASKIKSYKDDCNDHYTDINSSFEKISDSLGRYSSFLKAKEPITNI